MTQTQKAFGIHLSWKTQSTKTVSCQTFFFFLNKRGCLTASSFGRHFISLWYGLEAGCTITTLTHICGIQGPLITICCLLFAMTPSSVDPYFLWFVFGNTQAFYITFYHSVLTLIVINNQSFMTSCTT